MKYITIKRYKTYKYKNFTIVIWKTNNKSFILETPLNAYLGDAKYLSEEGKDISREFKGAYIWDVAYPDGGCFHGFFNDLPYTFCVVDGFRATEQEVLFLAVEAIENVLNKLEIEKLGINLPSHFYDTSSGKVVPMAACLNQRYDPETSQVIFNYRGREISISV
ncbi:MAG: hypothetical protein QNJ64_06865 [Crocosphaera sp.]|nr:hypothetical protein [Crocosphaera sp.]